MKTSDLQVISNKRLSSSVYEIVFEGAACTKCGQFVELTVKNCYLKRPFGVAAFADGKLTVLYKVVGRGTKEMTHLAKGDKVSAFVGLGNGFDTARGERPLIVGGGIGSAPLYYLAKELCMRGVRPEILLAFRTKNEAYYVDEFSALGNVHIATDDGSLGYRGNALEALKYYNLDFDFYYACGPMPMLGALAAHSDKGQLSLEARMGCGFGACMGCSVMTAAGAKRVCKEGPVFEAGEVIFR